MYREKIREYYDHLSRSYRKVADYIMSNYYDVAFMTAAQLAYAVGVDTTTVVRFSQRLGYNGYPDLLHDVREQVKSEIYAAYEPKPLAPNDPAGVFNDRIEQERQNLQQMLIQNPPVHLEAVARLIESIERVVVVGEGYAEAVAEMVAQQFRHRGIQADYLPNDAVKKAATLMTLDSNVLVIGISATAYGRDVARAMEFARARGAKTLGIIGSLASPVNRISDLVIYAPTEAIGPLPSIVALDAALSGLVLIAAKESEATVDRHLDAFEAAYQFLTQEDVITAMEAARVPEEA
ncbi:MAG: MurR/RpiR family transcriptional regulator [Caldilineaceae bacterium]|jgi:DNA-binding MurR/RpiR family transcriptional regulator|nr:MurR/RpiR family transcriptional regulator [Caldilineaceae bacterium]